MFIVLTVLDQCMEIITIQWLLAPLLLFLLLFTGKFANLLDL